RITKSRAHTRLCGCGLFCAQRKETALDEKKGNVVMTWPVMGLRWLRYSLLTMAVCAITSGSWAQVDALNVDIAPQELDHALSLFAEQTKVQVLYSADLVRGMSTQGVTVAATPQDALRQLLSGTGFVYTFVDSNRVAVHKMADTFPVPELSGPASRAAETKPKRVKLPEVVVKDV